MKTAIECEDCKHSKNKKICEKCSISNYSSASHLHTKSFYVRKIKKGAKK
jgi:hypothetical protein